MHPKKYDGARDVDAFISFIRREAGVKPIILRGEPDAIDYDYTDGEIVAETEEDVDQIVEGEKPSATTTTATPTTPTPQPKSEHDEL